MSAAGKVLRLGARGSLLSRLQSTMVAKMVEARFPEVRVELITIATSGDQIQDRPLHEFGGKGLFTKELEQALLKGDVDFAVHSYKDVPVTMPLVDTAELVIAATPLREDPRDVLVSALARTLADLPAGARVGTGSLRRQAQVMAARPDVRVEPIRGNVDTRLGKWRAGEYGAVILAMAGLKRSGLLEPKSMTPLETDVLLPSAAQGALALECRREDQATRQLLETFNDPASALAVRIERMVVQGLNGDCHSPIAAYAKMDRTMVRLQAVVAARGGRPPIIKAEALADLRAPERAAEDVLKRLKEQGAIELLGTP